LFRLKLFGSASIEGPDGPVTGRAVQRRRLGLLALLAVARERGLTRDRLAGYLWPDADPERARHMLSDSMYRINQAVGGDAVLAVGDDLRLNPDRLPADAWEFADAIARQEWERAAELHAAPFLDGFFLTDSDELERWVDAQRERFARDRARALEELAVAAGRTGDMQGAVRWWRALAASDPFSSRIALRLMRALDASGDRAADKAKYVRNRRNKVASVDKITDGL
jgi:DNA-binding SARP family transcriptional activator